jgi:hypothetical protein
MFSVDCGDRVHATQAALFAGDAESAAILHTFCADSATANSLPFSVAIE